jgi:hypothetical protein
MEDRIFISKSKNRIISALAIGLIMIGFGAVFYKIQESIKILHKNTILIKDLQQESSMLDMQILEKKALLKQIDSINNSSIIVNKRDLINDQLSLNKSLENASNSDTLKITQSSVIYIQVNSKKLLADVKAQNFIGLISSPQFKVYGYDLEENRADNTIRYFNENDKDLALQLKGIIDKKTSFKLQLKQIKGYENRVKKGQLEIWLK